MTMVAPAWLRRAREAPSSPESASVRARARAARAADARVDATSVS